MKRNNLMFMAMAAIAAVALVSCNKAEIDSPETAGNSVVVKAYVPDDMAKTTFAKEEDHYAVKWDSNDKVALLYKGVLYESKSITRSADNKCAEFTFDGIDSLEGEYQLFYPFSAAKYDSETRKVTMTFGNSQGSRKTSPYASATIMMAEGSDTNPVTFRHLVAYAKMTVMGLPAGEMVDNVQIYKWHAVFYGDIVYNPEDGSLDYKTSEYKESPYIWFMGDSEKTVEQDGTLDVWYAFKPMTLKGDFRLTTNMTDKTKYEANLKFAKDVLLEAGKVTSFPVYSQTYLIKFNTHGGSAVGDQYIQKGGKVRPVKTSIYSKGLYEGDITDLEAGLVGWYLNEDYSGDPIDFSTYVPEGDVTLHAKWASEAPKPLATILRDAFSYVSKQTGTNYTYVMTANETVGASSLMLENANAVLKIVGAFKECVITQDWGSCSVINCSKGHVIIGENVTLTGTNLKNAAAVNLSGGSVTMLDGSKITGCTTATGRASAVYLNESNSTFTIEGGEICNNVLVAGSGEPYAGTICSNNGKIIIKGGKIHDNSVSTPVKDAAIGGACQSPIIGKGNAIQKKGGEIYDNTAVYTGEGTGYVGQQIFIGNHGREDECGLYKVDKNLSATDNLEMDDRTTNPLWVVVYAPTK